MLADYWNLGLWLFYVTRQWVQRTLSDMHKEFFIGFGATATVFAYQCRTRKPLHSRFWWAQAVTLCCQIWLCFGFYSPLVSKHAYEWQVMSADLICVAFDCWAVLGLLVANDWLRTATLTEAAVVILMLIQRDSTLQAYWSSDAFRWPDDPALQHMRFATNLAYLCAIALLYAERGKLAIGATHGTQRDFREAA